MPVQESEHDFSSAEDKILRLYEYERTKNLEAWAALWADDAKVTFNLDVVSGQRDFIGKESIVAWTAKKFDDRATTRIDHRLETIVGGRRIVAHLDVEMVFNDGVVVAGPLLIFFTFNAEGKIVLMEEYVNELVFPIDYKEKAAARAAAAAGIES